MIEVSLCFCIYDRCSTRSSLRASIRNSRQKLDEFFRSPSVDFRVCSVASLVHYCDIVLDVTCGRVGCSV